MDERVQMPLVLGGFGLVFLLVGLWVAWSEWREPESPVFTLPVGVTSVGAEVLVEGKLSAATPVLQDGLSLFQREVAKGETKPGSNDVRFTWVAEGVEAPPFSVETSAGLVRVRLVPEATWADAPRVVEANEGSVTAGKTRLHGFAPGDQLTVQGKVISANELEAHVIRGGTVADYRAQEKKSGAVGLVLGGLFALAGLGVLITAALQITKR